MVNVLMEEGALSREDKLKLRISGFMDYEIRKLNNAKTSDGKVMKLNTDSSNWRSMLRTRKMRVNAMKMLGWTTEQIQKALMNYYKTKGATVFDHLQVEVSPSAKSKQHFQLERRIVKGKKIKKYYKRQEAKHLQKRMF
jgi:hypothetical protein